jgi:hypothetical protein
MDFLYRIFLEFDISIWATAQLELGAISSAELRRSRIEFSPVNSEYPLSGLRLLGGVGIDVLSVRSVSGIVAVGDGETELGSGKMIGTSVGFGALDTMLSCWSGDPASADVGLLSVGVLEAAVVGTGKTNTVDVGLGVSGVRKDVGKAEVGMTTGVI